MTRGVGETRAEALKRQIAESRAQVTAAENDLKEMEVAFHREAREQVHQERRAHPVVYGDSSVVAPHHFGSSLVDDSAVDKLDDLHGRLRAASVYPGLVPLVCRIRYERHWGDGQSTRVEEDLVGVFDPAHLDAPYESSWSVQERSMHAFTNQTDNVETTTLKIRSTWSSLKDRQEGGTQGLTLRSSVYAPSATGIPSAYAFSNSEEDPILNFSESPDVGTTTTLYVGWEELNSARHKLGDKLLGRLTRAMNALGGLRADSGKLAEHSELPPVYQVVRLLGQIEVLKGEIKALMR